MEDDATLLSRAADGDAEALRALLENHGRQVWSTIDSEIAATWRSLIDADDVMQVTYMEAFLYCRGMQARDGVSFLSWLREIARNNLRDAIKELERKKRPSPAKRIHSAAGADSHTALIELIGQASSTPSRQVAQKEAASAIEAALARMPLDYARVIRLYDLEERGIEATASELNRSGGAVYMLRARAHDLLRALLGDATDFFTRTT